MAPYDGIFSLFHGKGYVASVRRRNVKPCCRQSATTWDAATCLLVPSLTLAGGVLFDRTIADSSALLLALIKEGEPCLMCRFPLAVASAYSCDFTCLKDMMSVVTCADYQSCFESSTIATMNNCLNGGMHGPVHAEIGGLWNNPEEDLLNKLGQMALITAAPIRRSR